ncbi:putative quercetin 2,3-dioxygenase [Caldovatus sediminis]|uniref:Putative quercetin 2,3-dioxygenase n=1 Tax=Caldovatus sediminis TaxID=2041189 RepID=A0A8J3EB16_9PROT|nr:pirin family protein [Caldovatus sediminis]GGG18775.1 putative quercetin 2,3-dioxygenase [Caldovatus sediminis]
MIEIRPFATLGGADHGWLKARHHFAFAHYRDPARMGWGRLRVWNDDEIAPGAGFDPHPHRDMEIVTYVREGAITHRDDLGNEGRTAAGDVQVMSAGTGIVHSEYNLEPVTTRIFQIWILPDRRGARPGWGARRFPRAGREARLAVLAGGRPQDAGTAALPIHADAAVLAATLRAGQTLRHPLAAGRVAYLVPATGAVAVNGVAATARDGVAIRDEAEIAIAAREDAELVMVETAAG